MSGGRYRQQRSLAAVLAIFGWCLAAAAGTVELHADRTVITFGEGVSFTAVVDLRDGLRVPMGGAGDIRRQMVIVDMVDGVASPYGGRRRDLLPDSVRLRGEHLEIVCTNLLPLPGTHVFNCRVPLPDGGVLQSPPVRVRVRTPGARATAKGMGRLLVAATELRHIDEHFDGPYTYPPAPGLRDVCFARPEAACTAIGELLAACPPWDTSADWRRLTVLVPLLGDLADAEQATAHGVGRTVLPGATLMTILEKERTPAVVVALLKILPNCAPELASPEVHERLVRELRRRRESFYGIAFAAYAALLDPRLVTPEDTADLDLPAETDSHPKLTLRQKHELRDMAAGRR